MSYTWAKFNLLPQFFSFLVLNQVTTATSSSSCSSKGGIRTTVSIDEWSLTGYVSTLVIFVDIGYFPFSHSVAFVLCLYILLINIFFPLYCRRKEGCILYRRQFFGYILEAFLYRCIAFLTIHELLLIGRKT